MKIVKFENGKYGVRMHWAFGWHFLDLVDRRYKWLQRSEHFRDWQTVDLEWCQRYVAPIRKNLPDKIKLKYTIYKE
jgi:hypothetical protein